MLAKLRALALILAFIAAAVPSFMYITDANRDWLWIHIGINIFAYITVALTTIQTTLDVAGRDKHKLPVPARFQNNPILAKWWTAVRLSWRWHALAALARVGLAHALAQHLHIIWSRPNDFQGILSKFVVGTYSSLLDGEVFVRSQWITALVGAGVLVAFAMAESAFLSALTLYMVERQSFRFRQIVRVTLARVMFCFLTLISMVMVYQILHHYSSVYWRDNIQFNYATLHQWDTSLRPLHRISFALLDNGTMIATEIMLPVGDYLYFSCTEYGTETLGICANIDNFPHVLKHIVWGLGGLSLYAALTAFCLWLAQRRYRRQSSSVS